MLETAHVSDKANVNIGLGVLFSILMESDGHENILDSRSEHCGEQPKILNAFRSKKDLLFSEENILSDTVLTIFHNSLTTLKWTK